MLMKSVFVGMGLVLAAGLTSCASDPPAGAGAAAPVAKEERCMVTGSNVPKRDCRNDVVILPPEAAGSVVPVQPGIGNRP
jgi:hypothetical protein